MALQPFLLPDWEDFRCSSRAANQDCATYHPEMNTPLHHLHHPIEISNYRRRGFQYGLPVLLADMQRKLVKEIRTVKWVKDLCFVFFADNSS